MQTVTLCFRSTENPDNGKAPDTDRASCPPGCFGNLWPCCNTLCHTAHTPMHILIVYSGVAGGAFLRPVFANALISPFAWVRRRITLSRAHTVMFMLRLRVWLGMPWWPWRPWRPWQPWLHTPFAFACTMAYCAGWGPLLLSKQMFRRGRFSGEVNYGCHSRVRSLVRLAISQNHPVAYHRLFPAISPRLLFIYTPAYIQYTETVFRESNTHTHTHLCVCAIDYFPGRMAAEENFISWAEPSVHRCCFIRQKIHTYMYITASAFRNPQIRNDP